MRLHIFVKNQLKKKKLIGNQKESNKYSKERENIQKKIKKYKKVSIG